jgi:AcrR family transcriptional regulator
MSPAAAAKRSGQATRARILEAAILRFSQHSYEEATLRDIAADVGVDVAFVHRSFGSKEQLFAEVMKAAVQPETLFGPENSDLSVTFTKRLLEPSLDGTLKLVDPLDIFVRSVASPQALPVLRAFIVKDFIEPLAARLGTPTLHRAALIAAYLLGIDILRNVVLIDPLLEEQSASLGALIESTIRFASGNVPMVRRPPKRKSARAGAKRRIRRREDAQ